MTPVGGSRHYTGSGLGQITLWGCPSCGEDNTGPLTQGCVHCGAGRPPAKAETPTPPIPRVSARTPDDPTYDDNQVGQGDVADAWAARHAQVTIAEAYRSGYLDGIRAARAAQGPTAPAPAPPVVAPLLSTPAAWRTAIVALGLFRDNVLAGHPEEVANGEWLSVDDVTTVIAELQQLLDRSEEPAHA